MKDSLTWVTWDQAQFSGSHTFSLTAAAKIGLYFRFACPPESNFQSETKIEPDLRLNLGSEMWKIKLQKIVNKSFEHWT